MLATMSSKVLILAAVLAAGSLAAADDLTPLQLAIPDAPIVIGMNFDHIRLAYAGSRYQELLTPENRAQYEQRWKSMKDMLGFDLSQLQEAVISVRPGPAPKSAQGLLILRGPFDPDHPPVILMFLGVQRTMFEGVPLLVTKPGKGDPVAIAFLGRTLALAGDPPSVRAAISRWKAGSASHSPLLAKAEEMNRTFHVWCLARDLQSAMPHDAALPKGTDAIERAFQSIEEITVGMTLAPGFRASVDLVAHAAKDAAALQGAVSVAMAIAMAQSAPQKAKDFLKGVEITSKERTVRLSLVISEEKMIEAFKEQMKQGSPWWKGTPLGHPGGATVSFGEVPQAPQSTEVVVQGGEAASKPATPANTGDTQVKVLPR